MLSDDASALLWGAMERAADSLGLDLGEDAREIVEDVARDAEILAGWRYGDRPTEEQAAACRRSVGRECAGARNPAVCRELCRFD